MDSSPSPKSDENHLRPYMTHSHSMPHLPQLQLTTTDNRNDAIDITTPATVGSKKFTFSDEDLTDYHLKKAQDELDREKIPERSSNDDYNAPGIDRRDSANTLVEAALEKPEVEERHSSYQDHVAESAALVDRMLSQRVGPNSMAPTGGGSVLSSLMKLEAQRNREHEKRQEERKRRKEKKKQKLEKKKQRPASIYNLPTHYETDPIDGYGEERPQLKHRPGSWLSTITTTDHLVPSLAKRKAANYPASISRRSSVDSMITTASQFEPISLEDRIRITFELANILQKQDFLRKLARTLIWYGCPSHRLEIAMKQVSKTLGVDAEYVYLPNVMLLNFLDTTTHQTETHFIRQVQGYDMYKLGEIYRLEKLVSHGEVTVDEALEFIESINDEKDFYPRWTNPLVYAAASFCTCTMFFGGQWKDAGVAAALGTLLSVYETFAGRFQSLGPIWDITMSMLIGFIARAPWRQGFCFAPISYGAIVILLPGYTIASGIIELASRNLISGVVRMVYSIVYCFLLGYGISMGSGLWATFDPAAASASTSECTGNIPSQWYNFLFVSLFAFSYAIYLKARPNRWIPMFFVSTMGYVVNFSLTKWTSAPQQVTQFIPAFVVGLLGNLMHKFTGKMSFDAVLLGVFFLVPGSLGLKAALGTFSDSTTGVNGGQGAYFALAMIESAIGITVGLFVATLVVYPRGTAHTPLMCF
ncbi:hypothetical protein K450DRAFT_248402 [Umbelopsis ramanniana AG]|uniref:Threonine/serine exporter-like N-terminal domain-containing protein n=1 Tax=Umbelopsis ramanniana AG TaxID=1314678 RepID=A0AAD5HD30_UMBRA|nr:uncharacterized protein K450DRAFT_248402 [Umbelopsis ramanniana AG]KAI8578161.1 hypothetical protein K450DRAFT_248402 [Umbelopsis ramanniana AG]